MRLLGQAAWVFADRAAFAGSIFATGVLIARTCGPEGFGLYLWVSAIVQTVLGAIAVGAEVPFVRAYAGHASFVARMQVLDAFTRALRIAAMSAAVLLVMAGLAAGWLAPNLSAGGSNTQLMLFAGVASLIQLPWMLGEWRLRSSGQAARIARIRVPFLCASFCVKALLAIWGAPLHWLYLAIGLESALMAWLLCWQARQAELEGNPDSPVHLVVEIPRVPEALRLGLASIVVVAFFRLNPVILGLVAGVSETAAYGAALALVLTFDLVTTSISSAMFPSIVRDRLSPHDSLQVLRRLGNAYAGLAAVFVIAMFAFGDWLLALVYGPSWERAHPVLMVLSLSTLFTSSAAIRGLYINLIGRSDLHLANGLLGVCALLPLSLALSGQYGSLGAAVSMTLACALSGIVGSFLFEPTREIGRVQLRAFLPGIR